MLSATMFEKNDIQVIEVNKPTINENEILIKVKAAGICGTDLRIYRNGFAGINKSTPRILGHEFSGVIEEVGEKVSHYEKGMRVTASPNMGCGKCKTCISNNGHLCSNYKAIGVHLDGAFAQYVKIPERAIQLGNVMEIPDHISFKEASIVEPLACVYSGIEKCKVKMGDSVLVIGAGPIGIMHALFAKKLGASKVIVSNRSTNRLEVIKHIDNTFITVPNSNLKEEIEKITDGKGVDVCIIACSSSEAQQLSLELMNVNGRINFFGGLPKGSEMVELNTNLIHYKQLLVTGTTKASNKQFKKTLDFISSGIIDVDKLITNEYEINDIKKAFDDAMNSNGLKTLIVYD